MSEFSITSSDFDDGEEIPKKFGHEYDNEIPKIEPHNVPADTKTVAMIMDDPDAMAAVGKVWVHWLTYWNWPVDDIGIEGRNDFNTCGYDGPAPPDKRHTYIFKMYALDTYLDLEPYEYRKQDIEDAMKGHIIAEAKLTGTFAP